MNAIDSCLDTKRRIIEVARRLFAENGFDATSVREIAGQSQVNIAAINYHFKTKENLYWAIIRDGHEMAEDFCKKYFEESSTVEELALKVLDRFQNEGEILRNYMKMSLSTHLTPQGEDIEFFLKRPMGPPGGKYFAELIAKEVPYQLNAMGILWGQKAIFGVIIHWATMCLGSLLQCKADPLLSPEQIREDVRHMVRASLDYLVRNPKIFSEESSR